MESVAVRSARRVAAKNPSVLNDIRLDIDAAMADGLHSPLEAVNLDAGAPPFVDERPGPLELTRLSAGVAFSSGGIRHLAAAADGWRSGATMLLTNLTTADPGTLAPQLPRGRHVIGLHDRIEFWVLPGPEGVPGRWRSSRSTPFGMRA